jgi:hypothetical protein
VIVLIEFISNWLAIYVFLEMYDIDVLLETGNSVLLVTNLYPELSVFTLTQSLNRNYSAILATLQITSYALGV